jgi:hypothetical protein
MTGDRKTLQEEVTASAQALRLGLLGRFKGQPEQERGWNRACKGSRLNAVSP